MKTKSIICAILTAFAASTFAGPHPMHHGHHAPPPRHYYHHHWRPDPVWPIVFGTAAIVNSFRPVPPPPPVVVGPVVQRQIWVNGHYETQYLPNGTTTVVWIPGHYQLVP